jgi:hypothetical protein
MPQTDADKQPATTKLNLLQKGIVNFKEPADKDVQKESLREARRMQMLAGINKR